MDIADNIRLGQAQQVIVALKVGMPVSKTLTAEVLFLQCMALDHGTHGAI